MRRLSQVSCGTLTALSLSTLSPSLSLFLSLSLQPSLMRHGGHQTLLRSPPPPLCVLPQASALVASGRDTESDTCRPPPARMPPMADAGPRAVLIRVSCCRSLRQGVRVVAGGVRAGGAGPGVPGAGHRLPRGRRRRLRSRTCAVRRGPPLPPRPPRLISRPGTRRICDRHCNAALSRVCIYSRAV